MSYQILIVDDDIDFRAELCDYLSGYRTLEASSGDEALKVITKPNVVDLVILDVVMPGTNGIEVLKEMKKRFPDLSIIILTGKDSKDTVVDALRGHADDYFEKPLELDRLDEAIKRNLSRKGGGLVPVAAGKNHKIERAKRFIEKNYDKMVNLKDVAAEVCLCPKYLSRIFKEDEGVGFKDYQLKIRTQKAKMFLSKTEYPAYQIAEKFGYKNLESFIRLFKKTTGLTPVAYRKSQKNKTSGKRKK